MALSLRSRSNVEKLLSGNIIGVYIFKYICFVESGNNDVRVFRRLLVVVLVSVSAQAQWLTQAVELEEGWNAVYLTVQPLPASCDTVFEGLPVDRAMMWCRTTDDEEYLSDFSDELARPSDWLVWRPAGDEDSEKNTLNMLLAGEAYLVKMTNSATLEVKGRPELVHPEWIPNEMTLTGVPVGDGVTFETFFAHTDEIGDNSDDGGEFYEVLADGSQQQVYFPKHTDMQDGKAYWINTGQVLDYDGSLKVSLSSGADWLDFGSDITERRILLENMSDEERTVTLELLAGESPNADYPAAEGPVPLSTVACNVTKGIREYVDFSGLTTNIAAYESVEITLMPRVNEMSADDAGAVWQSLLKVSDGEVEQTFGIQCEQEDEAFTDPTGLWVGTVAVDGVSRAPSRIGYTGNTWDTETPVAVSEPYSFRVLMHVASNGTCRLLQRAVPAWVIDDGGETVSRIFTDVKSAADFMEIYADAEVARISSANFPLMDPLPMVGTFGSTNELACTVALPFDDAVNPFVHPYHPDHDNKEYSNGTALPLSEGEESFDVQRVLSFTFAADDPLGANPRWAVSEFGGDFKEQVTGLNKTIFVSGAFRLEKVSDCGFLSYLDQGE